MGKRAFFISGGEAAIIANDIADTRYHAGVHHVPVGVQVPARLDTLAETQVMLEDGMLEFMVGGAAAMLMAPSFVRIPPGVPYAFRNVGDETARLLIRSSRPAPSRRMVRAHVEYAA